MQFLGPDLHPRLLQILSMAKRDGNSEAALLQDDSIQLSISEIRQVGFVNITIIA